MIEEQLAVYKTRQAPPDLGLVVRDDPAQSARAPLRCRPASSDAVRLDIAQAHFTGLPPKWQPINDYGAKVQAHVIDKIEHVMPVGWHRRLANPLFRAGQPARRLSHGLDAAG
ncbi:hypothetical protein ACNKHS_05395 [Shigella flexneri]